MSATVIASAAAIGLSVPLLWWSVSRDKSSHRVARNLAAAPAKDLRDVVLASSASERAVRPAVRTLARHGRRITPAGLVDALERRIVLAGRPPGWSLERALAAKLLLGIGGVLIGVLVCLDGISARRLLLAAGAVALGYLAPDVVLYLRGRERQKAIQRQLPDTLDQMSISVEAGLGFESAMAKAAKSGGGPLADELIRTLQELQIGSPRAEAMRNLAERTEVPDLRHFVLAVIQAENYGIPIVDVLRTQSKELRVKRRQRAEERAMKIPVKIVFPLVFCILPTLFIVVLGPAVIRIWRDLFSAL